MRCLVLLALAAAAACSKPEPRIPDPDTSGMETAVVDAVRTTRARVQREPGSGEAWAYLAGVLDAHDFSRDAEIAYRRAIELVPNDPKLPYNLAVVLDTRGGEPDEVLALYRRFAQLEPKYPPVYFRIGGTLARKGDLAAAAEAYRTALALDPRLAIARRSLGQVLIAQNEAQAAITELERVAAQAPGDRPTEAALAQAFALAGDELSASGAAARARTMKETLILPDPVRFLVVQMGRSSRLVSERASIRAAESDLAGAIEDLKFVLRSNPADANVHFRLADLYGRLGQEAEARRHRDEAAKLLSGR